ncbi:glycoside hydrolase family 1 protein [Heyndrickxia oleronia]|uniref:glycoside hydrolase family 1 protein n=1 Tax=Heyndrickxia oleronia TaxID=38875 RepID=UPI001C0EC843|nr:glycoside hydrolase family 1 protein [Heyndrickxia oleronia]MBU5213019.1 glycoside hydrolase family 1 protein [Heyndrickxia oleronia]
MKRFPQNFWWGAATSGPQSEGRFNKKHANVFDYWYEVEPEEFYGQIGPDTASNFYNSYVDDIQLMKEIGLNSVRTSIQWTRLIDDFESATVNEDGVDYYNKVINEFIKQGITPVMALHHFDLPVELYHKYGGWESKHVVELFAKFAGKCFELFGDRVKHWFTFNEPMVIVDGQYLYQFHYPNVIDGKKAVQVAYNLNLASAKAIKVFKELGMHRKDAQIGIILNLTPSYPASQSEEDVKAGRIADLWRNEMFLKTAIYGEFPEKLVELLTEDKVIWESTDEELNILKNNTIDVLGVNFYHPSRVKAPDISPNSTADWTPDRYYDQYEMPGRRMNIDKGWEIYPQALYDIAINIRDNYKNIKWFVSENGMGVSKEERFLNDSGVIEDDYRIDFIKEHLEWLHKGIEEGSNCFGYHLWTPIDCWSWKNAYRNRYGFISNNIHTQVKTIKKSGYWIKEVSKNNGFL